MNNNFKNSMALVSREADHLNTCGYRACGGRGGGGGVERPVGLIIDMLLQTSKHESEYLNNGQRCLGTS